jgi:integrase
LATTSTTERALPSSAVHACCRAVRLPKVKREEMRFLNPAEVAWLADMIDSRYRALVLVAAYGGLRIGELAGLAGLMGVRRQGLEPRTVALRGHCSAN